MNQFEMKQRAYQSNLKSRALQVLLYLIDRANKEQICFPAVPTIGRELHISISTVKRAMRELVEAGYVTKESRFREGNRGQTSNLYTLYFPEEKNMLENDAVQEKPEQLQKEQSGQTDREAVVMPTACAEFEGQDGDNIENISVTGTVEDRNVLENISENKCGLLGLIKGYMKKRNSVKSDDYEDMDWAGEKVYYDRKKIDIIKVLLQNGRRILVRIYQWPGEGFNLIPP